MWKIVTLAGTLGHAVIGTSSMVQAAIQPNPVNWLQTGAAILGPGLIALAATLLMVLASRPPEVLAPLPDPSKPGGELSYPWK